LATLNENSLHDASYGLKTTKSSLPTLTQEKILQSPVSYNAIKGLHRASHYQKRRSTRYVGSNKDSSPKIQA